MSAHERPRPYNPSVCSAITTTYDGPHKRPIPHDEGVWYRKLQSWRDADGREVGAWRWIRGVLCSDDFREDQEEKHGR